jgi:hypothetical protein
VQPGTTNPITSKKKGQIVSTTIEEKNIPAAVLQRFTPTDSAILAMSDEYMPLAIHGVEDSAG